MDTVGVIGLGVMGEPICALLLNAGYTVAVYDVRPEPVARLAKLGAEPCASGASARRRLRTLLHL